MKKTGLIILALIILSGIGTLIYSHVRFGRNTLPPQYFLPSKSSPATANLDHVIIIMEENKPKGSIIGNADAPYINKLAGSYAQAPNYYAVTNPSLPNYLALTSGTTAGIANDCNPPGGSCTANVQNIADRLEQGGKNWKEYAESMPQPCYAINSGDYAVKHNPFMYYSDIRDNGTRCKSHVVPFSQFTQDLSANKLPDYSFITPNLCDDMHNCPVAAGDSWLARQVPAILASDAFKNHNSLLVITWDEGNTGNNNVPIIFAGPAVKQHFTSAIYYSHYSLLHTIEDNWKLPPLTKNDASAPTMTALLR